jgi:hypothetical protein
MSASSIFSFEEWMRHGSKDFRYRDSHLMDVAAL